MGKGSHVRIEAVCSKKIVYIRVRWCKSVYLAHSILMTWANKFEKVSLQEVPVAYNLSAMLLMSFIIICALWVCEDHAASTFLNMSCSVNI